MKSQSNKYSLEDSLAHLSARFYRAMWKDVTRGLSAQDLEITVEQWPILIHLWDRDGQSQKDLAQKLFKDKTTIARLVARIESSGIVQRETGLEDRREKKIFLTEKGKEIMNRATAMVQKTDSCAEQGISAEQLATCKKVLRQAHKNLAD